MKIDLTKDEVQALRTAIDMTLKRPDVKHFSELFGVLAVADSRMEELQKKVEGKGHPEWCGKVCAECKTPCDLDVSLPCSLDCEELDNLTGEPSGSAVCKECDVYHAEGEYLDKPLFEMTLSWRDAIDFLGEKLKDTFLGLLEDERRKLMDEFGHNIGTGLEWGIMEGWSDVMSTAVDNSGLIEELDKIRREKDEKEA